MSQISVAPHGGAEEVVSDRGTVRGLQCISGSRTDGGFDEEVAHAVLARLEAQYGDWFAKFDRVLSCPLSYEREFVLEALAEAPDPFLRGMLYSALVTARQIEEVTER